MTRGSALARLSAPVRSVRFVDSRRAEALGRLGVVSVEDLIRHYPFRYLDLASVPDLRSAPIGRDATVVGRIHDIKVKRPRPRLTVTEVALVDGTGAMIGVWFNQPHIAQRLAVGERVAFAGTVVFEYGLRQMRSPFVEKLPEDDDGSGPDIARILPVHRATEGISTNWMRRLVHEALAAIDGILDPLPAAVRADRRMMPLGGALRAIHFPHSAAEAAEARRRLVFDEFFALECALARRRHRLVDERTGISHVTNGSHLQALAKAFPYVLTGDQEQAVREILDDMRAPHPMSRMLLGDVGTGKTAVAAHALAAVADTGSQAAMMAPTEVLAAQYCRALGPPLDAAGITWALLTGSATRKERADILARLAAGEVTVALGTHALIEQDVVFERLSLAIVDEQHRFGVAQRLALRTKSTAAADMLVMTATPIPRTLALTIYGDLETSYLRERPLGRGPEHVSTRIVPHDERAAAYDAIRAAVASGHRAYVVCALVDESDVTAARAAVREAERLTNEVFPELRVGLLTGQMRPADKQAVMESFRVGEIDVLVATTVIEVGVDVPEATVMLIENAERYGLAQLHQLRGRVGRGAASGEVLIFAEARTEEARSRMEAFISTTDGFALAELDLRIRGEGDILGERQSGLGFRLASLADDGDLLDIARADAFAVLEADPQLRAPEHVPLGMIVDSRLALLEGMVDSG
jgi:ATP-dependent DNA helicase RecG